MAIYFLAPGMSYSWNKGVNMLGIIISKYLETYKMINNCVCFIKRHGSATLHGYFHIFLTIISIVINE